MLATLCVCHFNVLQIRWGLAVWKPGAEAIDTHAFVNIYICISVCVYIHMYALVRPQEISLDLPTGEFQCLPKPPSVIRWILNAVGN